MQSPRSSFATAFATWRALFLREASTRLSQGRIGWFWILFEPVLHVVFITSLFTFVRHRVAMPGIDSFSFILTAILSFLMLRNVALRSMGAIGSNSSLFAYRQVKPVDTVIVRAVLEGFLMLVCSSILLPVAWFFGFPVIPSDPLMVFMGYSSLWLFGFGLGLILSVLVSTIPKLTTFVPFAFRILYWTSGVLFSVMMVPQPYRDWALHNPVLHGLEYIHKGFFSHYHSSPDVHLQYLLTWAVMAIFLGLLLHRRFANWLVTR